MSLIRPLVRSSVSPLAISLLGGGAVSLGARVDAELEELIEAGGTVSQIEVQDLTSMFVGTDGSGGNPTVGDSVGAIVGSEGFGGKSFEQWLAGLDLSQYTDYATNGDTFSGWSVYGSASISSGSVNWSSAGDNQGVYFQNNSIPADTLLIAEIVIDSLSAGALHCTVGQVGVIDATNAQILSTATTHRVALFKRNDSFIRLYCEGTTTAVVSSIKLVGVPQASLWSAPSDTARPILLDTFSDPNDSALTDNGGRGPELVDPDGWALGSGWTNTNGVLSRDGTSGGSHATQLSLEPGVLYEIKWTQAADSEFVAVYIDAFSTVVSNEQIAKDYSFKVRSAVASSLAFRSNLPVTGVSNISVRKVLSAFDERGPELVALDYNSYWTDTGGADVQSSQVVFDSSLNDQLDSGALGLVDGVTYEVTVTVSGSNGGDLQMRVSGPFTNDLVITSDGTYTFKAKYSGTQGLRLRAGTTLSATVTNISVKRVIYPNRVTNGTFDADSDWTKGANWTIGGGLATKTSGSQNSLYQAMSLTAAQWYRVGIYVSSYTSGNITPRFIGGTTVSGDIINSAGWHFQYLRVESGNLGLDLLGTFSGAFSIDNVIVQEVPASISRRYFLRFDGVDDQLTLTDTFGSDMTVVMGMRTSDAQGMLLTTDDNNTYFGSWLNGSGVRYYVSAEGGVASAVTYRKGGATQSPSTRGDMGALISDGEFGVFALVGMDLSGRTNLRIAQYGTSGSVWSVNGDYTYLAIFPSDADTLALNEQLAAEVSGVTLP